MAANRDQRPEPIDPYRGPTEEDTLKASGTSREEIERLSEAFGVPSGFEDERADWLDDDEDSTSEDGRYR